MELPVHQEVPTICTCVHLWLQADLEAAKQQAAQTQKALQDAQWQSMQAQAQMKQQATLAKVGQALKLNLEVGHCTGPGFWLKGSAVPVYCAFHL